VSKHERRLGFGRRSSESCVGILLSNGIFEMTRQSLEKERPHMRHDWWHLA
jgi:hypothetical protein